MSPEEKQVRLELKEVGLRRRQLTEDDEKLRNRTEAALRAAQGVIPMEEAADLAGIGRATAYQSYLGGGNGQADGSRKGGDGPR